MGKRKGGQRETAFEHETAEVVERLAKDRSLSSEERLRYVRDAKHRKLRNVQKRQKGKRGKKGGRGA